MKREKCKIKDGKLVCLVNGKWKEISRNNIKIQSSKPFTLKENFNKKRTNVC